MANILFSFAQPIIGKDLHNIVCYYEGMAKELVNCGNNVCFLNIIGFDGGLNEDQKNKIKIFKPNLIVAFNNAVFPEVLELTDCPVVCFAEDSYYFFYYKTLLEKYRERYSFVSTDENLQDFIHYFNKDKMAPLHHATAVTREDLEKTNNISFIGQPFEYELLDPNRKSVGYKALLESYRNSNYDYDTILNNCNNNLEWNCAQIYSVFDSRVATLSAILELGVSIYGLSWSKLGNYCNQLYLAYNDKSVYSLADNQNIYNSSIININIQHPQCYGIGCAWRVYDIMASSGILISQHSSLLNKRTKSYVNIPMFDSPLQAADLCRKFLKEKNLREDIVSASNEFIDMNGRWSSNFTVISQISGIQLINSHQSSGKLSFIEPSPKVELPQIKSFSRIKNIKNGYRLIFSNLPLIEKLYNNKKIEKLYNSIDKNKII